VSRAKVGTLGTGARFKCDGREWKVSTPSASSRGGLQCAFAFTDDAGPSMGNNFEPRLEVEVIDFGGRSFAPFVKRFELGGEVLVDRLPAPSAEPKLTRVFVYGSLLSGLHNHRHFLGAAKSVGPARTSRGWALYSCGSFPAMARDEDAEHVVGELYDVTESELARLDQLEGIDHRNPDRGHYQHAFVAVFVEGRATPICATAYVQHPHQQHHRDRVPAGDWRAFVNARDARWLGGAL